MPPHQARGDARRAAIMAFLRLYRAQNGFAPSMREIGDAVGLRSVKATRSHLLSLQDQGFINIVPGVSRAIVLLKPAPDGWTQEKAS